MKIIDGFILKEIAGSYIVVPLRNRIDTFSAVVNLNETGAFLWKQLANNKTEDELVELLLSEYDVDKETAFKDVKSFIDKLNDAKLLEA